VRTGSGKDTGLRYLRLHGFAANRIWCELITLAMEPTTWAQMLALDGTARCWEPKRLRLRLFSVAGRRSPVAGRRSPVAGRLVEDSRRLRRRLARNGRWTGPIASAINRVQTLPTP